MPLPTIPSGNVASATAGAFEIANSCRFNDGDSPRLHRNQPGSPTNGKIFTFSCWFKLGSSTSQINLMSSFQASGSIYDQIKIMAKATHNQVLRIEATSVEGNAIDLKASQSLRDPTAWYHLVLAVDTTQGTAGNRDKVYLNGTQITSWQTETHSTEDDTWLMNASGKTITVGAYDSGTPSEFFDGYLAEVCLVDGQQLAPTSFGEFDEDSPTIWKPIDVSGLTFGNNGYYLDFEDSSALGNDVAGKGDFTVVNLAATDQTTDSPTNSFCTINPLDEPYGSVTLTEGNLVQVQTQDYPYNRATMGVASGKWYWEGKITASGNSDVIGIASVAAASLTDYLYKSANNYAYYSHSTSHGAYGNNALISSTDYDAYTTNDIISVALDLTNNKLYFAKNGTWANSGDPTSGSTGTGAVSITDPTSTVDGFYFPVACDYGGSPRATWSMNFGNPPHSISSGNADANGYGNFEYAPPSGYYALCTKNLAEYG